MPFYDIKLEKLYTYSRFLLKKLPKDISAPFQLGDDVSLEYYRLQKISEKSFELEDEPEGYLSGIKDAGSGKTKDEKAHLSEIIEVLNERFGTEFKEADRIFFHQIEEEMADSLESLGIQFTYEFVENTHDRSIVLDNGWKIVLGRGLDIYQKTNGWYDIAEYYQEKRLCKGCEITYVKSNVNVI